MLYLHQVRFISHMLDKHNAVLGKLPEFASLSRDLRAFVAANARAWDQRGDRSAVKSAATHAAGAAGAAAGTASATNADTSASGLRDVSARHDGSISSKYA